MAGSASDAPLCKGCRVRIAGLKGRPDLNGQEGDIIGDVNELERWPLKLDSGEKVKVKTGNLEVLDGWPGSDEDEEMEDKKGYDQLEDIDSLTELDLSCEERCGGQLLEVIGQRGLKLESLTLDFCANISDEALGFLRRLPRLKSLSLRSCDALSDAGLILMADPQVGGLHTQTRPPHTLSLSA